MKSLLKFFGIDPQSDREFKAALEEQRLVSHDGTEINRQLAAHMLLKSQSMNDRIKLYFGVILVVVSTFMFVSAGGSYILASGMLALGAILLGIWFFDMGLNFLGFVFSMIFGHASYTCVAVATYIAWGWRI